MAHVIGHDRRVYGKGVRPKDSKEALAQVRKVYADGGVRLRARMNEAVRVLRAQADSTPLDASRIGAFGFCFGGGAVLELARSGTRLAGVVSFHGNLDTYLPAHNAINTPVLVLNGANDKDVTVPIPLEIKWAGDTPVITLTDLAIPSLGTFTARVVIYDGRYAGTWQHGQVGGHLFGRIEKAPPEKTEGK